MARQLLEVLVHPELTKVANIHETGIQYAFTIKLQKMFDT